MSKKEDEWAAAPGPGRWLPVPSAHVVTLQLLAGLSERILQVLWWEGRPWKPPGSASSPYRWEINSFREEFKWIDFKQIICFLLRWNLWGVLSSFIFLFFKTEFEISAVNWDAWTSHCCPGCPWIPGFKRSFCVRLECRSMPLCLAPVFKNHVAFHRYDLLWAGGKGEAALYSFCMMLKRATFRQSVY